MTNCYDTQLARYEQRGESPCLVRRRMNDIGEGKWLYLMTNLNAECSSTTSKQWSAPSTEKLAMKLFSSAVAFDFWIDYMGSLFFLFVKNPEMICLQKPFEETWSWALCWPTNLRKRMVLNEKFHISGQQVTNVWRQMSMLKAETAALTARS